MSVLFYEMYKRNGIKIFRLYYKVAPISTLGRYFPNVLFTKCTAGITLQNVSAIDILK